MLALLLATSAQGAEWHPRPFVRPHVELLLYDDGSGTEPIVDLGAEAGVRYAQERAALPTWAGRTRIAGSYGIGVPGVRAWDYRAGSFLGPVFRVLGLESGLDVFNNELTVDGAGLQPSIGIDVPLRATLDFEVPSVWAGIGTAYLFDPDRRVDWSERAAFGFGHEFEYLFGAGLDLGVHLSAQYTHRVVATGDARTIVVGIGI
jgi:hypothetical protein